MLNLFSSDRKVFANGKELVFFEYDRSGTPIRAIAMQSFAVRSYSIDVGSTTINMLGQPSFEVPGSMTTRLELVSYGPIQIEEGPKVIELERRLQSAWNLPVSELLKIVYQKMEERES
jgi:hypothetical protein